MADVNLDGWRPQFVAEETALAASGANVIVCVVGHRLLAPSRGTSCEGILRGRRLRSCSATEKVAPARSVQSSCPQHPGRMRQGLASRYASGSASGLASG